VGIVDVPEYGVRGRRGDFEPLVSEELFYSVQAILSGRMPSAAPRQRAHPDFPLRGFVPMRVVWPWIDRELVERAQLVIRLLPLPSWLPCGEHIESPSSKDWS
jgi:hypothetical protein